MFGALDSKHKKCGWWMERDISLIYIYINNNVYKAGGVEKRVGSQTPCRNNYIIALCSGILETEKKTSFQISGNFSFPFCKQESV